MQDPAKVVWPGGFRPGQPVIVRRYTTFSEGGSRAGRVGYFPLSIWQTEVLKHGEGVVPIVYGNNREVKAEMTWEPVPADDLTLIGDPHFQPQP